MKPRLPSLTLIALLATVGAGGALAHEPQEAGMLHWLEHAGQGSSASVVTPRGAAGPVKEERSLLPSYMLPAEADSTRWLGDLDKTPPTEAGKPRGAAGPLKTERYLPSYMLPAEADSTRWLGDLDKASPSGAGK